ncbi:MAG: cell division protein FtsQ/DivIB [Rickettsiales bacterium]
MARKKSKLTSRQRQSQRIMREKAAMKKHKERVRKLQFIGAGIAVAVGLGGGYWIWQNNIIERTTTAIIDGAYQITIDAGFSLEAMYLEGRSRTSMAEIEKALGVKKGDAILRLSLDEAREKLEKIPSVRSAAVERALPGTLYVRIIEREPVALWQSKGRVTLIDDNGVVMNDVDRAPYQHLPLVVGSDAPDHVKEALSILAAEPALSEHFVAAVRVGKRRWNFRLEDGVEVKLPEQGAKEAWQKLADIHERKELLGRDVRVIDLRAPGKLFIKLSPEDMPHKAVGAKET